MLLSIIVPIYKVEKYLPKCIDSLLDQDIDKSEYEIILVDDGSPDRCGQICDQYALQYNNITVIHQINGGLSAARNAGIAVATGKYVQFVDSDDFLESNILGMLLEKMESKALDILRFNYQNVNEEGLIISPNKYSRPFVDYSSDVTDGTAFLNERLGTACYACQFMLRLDIVKSSKPFMRGLCYEDVEWTPRIILKAKRISSTSTIVYNYVSRIGSITSGVGRNIGQSNNRLINIVQVLDSQMKQCPNAKKWYHGMQTSIIVGLMSNIAKLDSKERNRTLSILQDLKVFPLTSDYQTKSAIKKNTNNQLFTSLVYLPNKN